MGGGQTPTCRANSCHTGSANFQLLRLAARRSPLLAANLLLPALCSKGSRNPIQPPAILCPRLWLCAGRPSRGQQRTPHTKPEKARAFSRATLSPYRLGRWVLNVSRSVRSPAPPLPELGLDL